MGVRTMGHCLAGELCTRLKRRIREPEEFAEVGAIRMFSFSPALCVPC